MFLLSIAILFVGPSRHCRGHALSGRAFLGSARAREARGRFLHDSEADWRPVERDVVKWNIPGISGELFNGVQY